MHASGPTDERRAGAQMQMVGVGQNHLGAKTLEITMGHRLDRAPRPNRRERGGLYQTVWRLDFTDARHAVAMRNLERTTFRHCRILHSVGTETFLNVPRLDTQSVMVPCS